MEEGELSADAAEPGVCRFDCDVCRCSCQCTFVENKRHTTVRFCYIGASARPMVAFSGFCESHKPPPSGNAHGIIPPPLHGHRNGLQSGYMLHHRFVCCRPDGRRGNADRVVDCVEQNNSAKIDNAWEKKCDDFKRCVEMLERGTPLHTWQSHQLSNTHVSCLNAKIRKEIEENEGSTIPGGVNGE